MKFKLRVVKLYEDGYTYYKLQEEFGLSPNTISNWIKLFGKPKIIDRPKVKDYSKTYSEVDSEVTSINFRDKINQIKDLEINFNSRFLGWLASILRIEKYWNLSKMDLKQKIYEEIYNI